MNLLSSWESHGIPVPALLALQWYDPVKIRSTFAEAAIIYVLASLLLRAPWFRSRSFEGAQKVLLFFNVAFAYKMALGFLLLRYLPGAKVTESFGVGYMLSTRMALYAHEKHIPSRLLRVTVQTSAVGVVVG